MFIYISENKELHYCPKIFDNLIGQPFMLDCREIHFSSKFYRAFDYDKTFLWLCVDLVHIEFVACLLLIQ